jgi:hypothetical protein
MLTRPRELDLIVTEMKTENKIEYLPLSKGVAGENWEEYLFQEAEALRKKNEAELVHC